MRIIKQSTSIDIGIGPFLDETDGKTAETALTITQPDIRLKKNGGNWAQKAAAQTLTHEEAGWYELTLDATDTDTVGQLIVAIHESGALPVWEYFQVVEEAIYDSLFAASAGALATAAAVDTVDNFLDTEIADILTDTSTTIDDFVDDLETRLTAALATALQAHGLGIGRGVVDAGSTTTAVVFKSVNGAAASANNDFYNGRSIVFTSGALALQACSISDYTGATRTATVPALTGAPAEDVTFIIV